MALGHSGRFRQSVSDSGRWRQSKVFTQPAVKWTLYGHIGYGCQFVSYLQQSDAWVVSYGGGCKAHHGGPEVFFGGLKNKNKSIITKAYFENKIILQSQDFLLS